MAMGACIGEAILGKKLGKKALVFGALMQSLPDFDFLAVFWMDTASNLLAHRGFTHSILFCIITGGSLAIITKYWHRNHMIPLKTWLNFALTELFVHILLDAQNAYGVGWFEPFSHQRVAFNTLFVVDPFFSIWSGLAGIVLLVLPINSSKRKIWLQFSIIFTTLYLVYGFYNKNAINKEVKEILQKNHITYQQFLTTPTPLNNWLWYVAVQIDSGYYIGYRSVFDSQSSMPLHYFPRNEHLLSEVEDHEALQHLLQFSKGYFTIEKRNDTLLFNDLRFGQVVGWYHPNEKFAFHYYLQHDQNALIVQRGRFAKWNEQAFLSLVKRIKGN